MLPRPGLGAARASGIRAGLRLPDQELLVLRAPASQALGAECRDLVLEVSQRLEAPVYRGEPEIRHLVEVSERAEDREAHLMRGDLPAAAAADGVLDLL